ncbi:unnamed protein product, partial [Mesorhabditis belari]|uniref:Uncharacterized protein n=1 Tax=Mesorhabditis belari TaxID=2138241 RepID=A0AAF3E9U9_9BILA
MATLFELSASDLYSIVKKIRPDAATSVSPDDAPSLQSKVTEWLLLNNFSTLHKFAKSDLNDWEVSRDDDCESCKKFKEKHKVKTQVIMTQPTPLGDLLTFDVKNGDPISPSPNETSRVEKSCGMWARECLTMCCRPPNRAISMISSCVRRKA